MKPVINKVICFTVIVMFLSACQKELKGDVTSGRTFSLKIDFKAAVDAEPFQLDRQYRNAFQEPYTVKMFKYYISNISLINTDSAIVYPVSRGEHFLIDASDPSSTVVSVNPQSHTYNYISFSIGVDSARNSSGAQTGALDPAKGMFWTWNSGYIMAKLEGSSPLSNQPNNKFEYHIGGFKGADNVVQNVLLAFPNAQSVDFLPGATGTISLSANVNAWFSNPHDLRIADHPVCTTPGELAKRYAENYSKMFSISGIVNNR